MRLLTRESKAKYFVELIKKDPIYLAQFGKNIGENPTPEDVDKLTTLKYTFSNCSVCNGTFETVVLMHGDCICAGCLKKALALLPKPPVREGIVVSCNDFCDICNELKTVAQVDEGFICKDCSRKVFERLSIEEISIVVIVPL